MGADTLKMKVAALSKNAAKVTEAQAVVKTLAASRRARRQAAAANCSEVNTVAVTLTTLVNDFPSSPDVLVYAGIIIVSSTVVCTDDEKAALAAVDAAFEEAVDHLNEAIEAGQSQLMTLTGATASPAEIAAANNETTVAPGNTTAAAGGPTNPATTVEGCQAFAVSSGDNIDNIVTFFTFSIREEECRTYYTGKRNCQNLVARQTLDIANINNCQTSG